MPEHSSLIFAHTPSELLCFHEFSSRVISSSQMRRAEDRAKLVLHQFKSNAFCNGKISLTSQRSTKNRLHNNLGNNLILLYYYYFSNFINFSQIQTKTLWENWLNLISFCNLSESAFLQDVLSHQMLLSYRISTRPSPPSWGQGAQGFHRSTRCVLKQAVGEGLYIFLSRTQRLLQRGG